MASISNIPEELLVDVISYFEFDRPLLLILARVSRRFHLTTRKFIFRSVEIPFSDSQDYDPLFDEPLSTIQARLLERSLTENAELQRFVRICGPIKILRCDLDSQWSYAQSKDKTNDLDRSYCTTKESIQALERYTNLRELSISCVDLKDEDNIDEYTEQLFKLPLLESLRIAKLERPGVPELLAAMLLPNIHTLTANELIGPKVSGANGLIAAWTSALPRSASSVRRLCLSCKKYPLMADYLGRVLSFASAIEELKCHGQLNVECLGFPPPEYTVNTYGVINALNNIRDTLKSLEIIIPPSRIIRCDGDPINLSQFASLKKLRISGFFMFRMGRPIPSRERLYQQIPRNLEFLQVCFHSHWAFLKINMPP